MGGQGEVQIRGKGDPSETNSGDKGDPRSFCRKGVFSRRGRKLHRKIEKKSLQSPHLEGKVGLETGKGEGGGTVRKGRAYRQRRGPTAKLFGGRWRGGEGGGIRGKRR